MERRISKLYNLSLLVIIFVSLYGCNTLKIGNDYAEVMLAPEYTKQFPDYLVRYDSLLESVFNLNKTLDSAEYTIDSFFAHVGYVLGQGIQNDAGDAFSQIINSFKGNGVTVDLGLDINGEDTSYAINIIDPPDVQEKYLKMKYAIEGIIAALPKTRDYLKTLPEHIGLLFTQANNLFINVDNDFSGKKKIYLPKAVQSLKYAIIVLEKAPGRIIDIIDNLNLMIKSIAMSSKENKIN